MYDINFTNEALQDLMTFKKFEQQLILSGIETQLVYEPTVETRNRFRMRPNEVAEWELRIDNYRVFYNVAENVQIVSIEAVGFKRGNQLYFALVRIALFPIVQKRNSNPTAVYLCVADRGNYESSNRTRRARILV